MSLISRQLSSSREFEFLLNLLKSDQSSLVRIESLLAEGLSWEILGQSIFLPQLHLKLQKLPEDFPVPESFKRLASMSFHKISLLNDSRLRRMKAIRKGLYEKGIDLLYLKGAAEIIDHYRQPGYLGSRPMGDVDFACRESDYLRIHNYLIETGNTLACPESNNHSDSDILEITGHYSYNPYSPKLLEMHVDSYMFDHQKESYPPDFAQELFQRSRRVQLDGSEFIIPSREDMLIYLICHAAGEKDYKLLCNRPYHIYDSAISRKAKLKDKVNNRFNSHQIRFLYQIDLFLQAGKGGIDFDAAMSVLSRVKSKKLIQQHLELVHFYTEQDVFLKYIKHQTRDDLLSSRRRYLEKLVTSQAFLFGLKYLFRERMTLWLKVSLLKIRRFYSQRIRKLL